MRLMKFGFATLAATLLASGCTERAPRSFVQPNVIKKTDLAGTWYYVQTVTDAPPSSASAFIGLSSELMKIRFDVQEGMLFARRAYEQIAGSEARFLMADAGSPTLVRDGADESALYVLMPMRV